MRPRGKPCAPLGCQPRPGAPANGVARVGGAGMGVAAACPGHHSVAHGPPDLPVPLCCVWVTAVTPVALGWRGQGWRHRCRGDGTEGTGAGGDSTGGGGIPAEAGMGTPWHLPPRCHHAPLPASPNRGVWGDPRKSINPISPTVAPKPEPGARGGPVTPATLLLGCSPPPGCGQGRFGERCGGAREGAVPAPCLTASAPPNLSVRHGREREGAGGRAGTQGGDGPGTAKGTRVTAARPAPSSLGRRFWGRGSSPDVVSGQEASFQPRFVTPCRRVPSCPQYSPYILPSSERMIFRRPQGG